MARQPLRIGTLGTARITSKALLDPARHRPDVAVTAIAARDPQRAAYFAAQHNIPHVHATYADLIADPDIDAIYNPLPNGLHGKWTLRAIQAGKHVLCEKPMAANANEAAMLAAAADQARVVLMEAFHTIYHPLAKELHTIVHSGRLGTIRHVEAHFCTLLRRRDDIRLRYALGGGAMMDLGCYTVRLLRYLLESEPTVVCANARCASPQVDRKMRVDLTFPGTIQPITTQPITGHMSCAFWSRRLIRITAKIVGDQGTLHVLNPLLPHLFHLYWIKDADGYHIRRCPGQSTYAYQLDVFLQAVRGEQTPASNAWDAVANMQVLDTVYQRAGLILRQPTEPYSAR